MPVSSLWKLRKLDIESLDPAALRVAAVHGPGLQLYGPSLVLAVQVSRKVRQADGGTAVERLEEQLPLQELRGIAERSALASYDAPRAVVQLWRIHPDALPRLQALRARARGWKADGAGPFEFGLGVELAGCLRGGGQSRTVTTLMRFTDPGEYIALVRDVDLADAMPAAQWAQRFPGCAAR